MKKNSGDWQSIENEKEKYAAYLCSREWSVLKEAVKERSRGRCERCKVLPGDAVHHLNYERKYNESLDDLQHNCKACHEFTHAKSDFDPTLYRAWLRYLNNCRLADRKPVPSVVAFFGLSSESFSPGSDGDDYALNSRMIIVRQLHDEYDRFSIVSMTAGEEHENPFSSALSEEYKRACMILDAGLPFAFALWLDMGHPTIDHSLYELTLSLFGFEANKN